MLRALIKYLHVELNERKEGLIPLQQAVLLEDPIHPAQALRSGHEGGGKCTYRAHTSAQAFVSNLGYVTEQLQ